MATSTVGFFSPFWGMPMPPLVAEFGDISTVSASVSASAEVSTQLGNSQSNLSNQNLSNRKSNQSVSNQSVSNQKTSRQNIPNEIAPTAASGCQAGLLATDLCRRVQWQRSRPESLLSWRNVRLMSLAGTGRSPTSPFRPFRSPFTSADSTRPETKSSPAAVIAPRPPAVPRVTVRPAAAPATGAQQVFKQCLDQGPNHAPADSEGIKRG
ncbi:MAG: hypothetical protein SNJ57_15030, partial [Cyanobacteriota bacterium]